MLLNTPTEIVGAGRTDSGVHASFYVAHFDYEGEQTIDTQQLCYKLNRTLPKTIAINRIYEVNSDMHARFDAVEREYTYVIDCRKNPFTYHITWHYSVDLDINAMNKAAHTCCTTRTSRPLQSLDQTTRVTSARLATLGGSLTAMVN